MTKHGLLDPAHPSARVVMKYRLGVVINPLVGDDKFEGWLSIPYITRRGVKAIKFRNLKDGDGAKYGQAKGQTTRLYNPEALFGPHVEIGIAEGEIDAIAATEGLSLPTVGIPGTQQWKAHGQMWWPLFKDFERVFVLRDGDNAGQDLADAITETLKLKARVINMPADMDVSKMLAAGRAHELINQFAEDDDDDGESG